MIRAAGAVLAIVGILRVLLALGPALADPVYWVALGALLVAMSCADDR